MHDDRVGVLAFIAKVCSLALLIGVLLHSSDTPAGDDRDVVFIARSTPVFVVVFDDPGPALGHPPSACTEQP
jgi:hypothetical protein